MSHHTVDYAAIIREKGGRLTPQREVILDAVCALSPHAVMDDILTRVQALDSHIDPSTVYRSVEAFCEMGLVACSQAHDHERVYEIAIGRPDHHHLHCTVCGTDLEVDPASFRVLFEALETQYGFHADADHLVLHGVCSACAGRE